MARVPRKARLDRRPLHLKIRVLAPKGTPKDEVVRVMVDAAARGVIPRGYRVHWIDWKKGKEGEANEGRLTEDLAAELRGFFDAITAPHTRLKAARVKAGH